MVEVRRAADGAATRPGGSTITADAISLRRDGKPWLATMGEFHYSRYPRAEWRDELLKMKAGGIQIVASYVFWIHHEEVENQWDFTGQRDLRAFVETCKDVGLPLVLRIGPWGHGEVRNGAIPEWMLDKGVKLRSDDPHYMAFVRPLYAKIAEQLKGELWKDGVRAGPAPISPVAPLAHGACRFWIAARAAAGGLP